jgi:hypothetical protein
VKDWGGWTALSEIEYGHKNYYSANYSLDGGVVMKQTIWTIILTAMLAVWGAWIGITLLVTGPAIDISVTLFGLYLMATLAVVAWMQTRWGALLVTVVALVIFLSEIISAGLFLNPQFGDQTVQILYASLTVILPVFGFLSYRSIKE